MKDKSKKKYLRALIVDDVKAIRTELKFLLQEYKQIEIVGEASNGEEAINIIDRLNPDVVFLDIKMPVFSGLEVLEKCRGNFKVIIISAFNKYLPETQKYNIVDFLMKPINKEKLNKIMMSL